MNRLSYILFNLSRKYKISIFMIVDFLFSIFSFYLAFFFLYGPIIPSNLNYIFFQIFISTSFIFFFILSGMYSNIFRFFNIFNFFKIIKIGIYNFLFLFFLIFILKYIEFKLVYGTSYSLIFIYSIFFIFFSSFLRTSAVIFYNSFVHFRKKNVLIIGEDKIIDFFLKSNLTKNFSYVKNIKNLDINLIHETNKKLFKGNLDEVIFSEIGIMRLSNPELLNDYIKQNNISLKILDKKILDLEKNSVPDSYLRNVKLEDLIHRTVEYKNNVDLEEVQNSSILITGAGGSIGSELSLKIISKRPKTLVLLDFSEINLFKLRNLIYSKKIDQDLNIKFVLKNLNNHNEISDLFIKYNFDYVYHAAAYKHVNIVEENKISAFKNNVVAFNTLIKISLQNDVKKFILISTDKAVSPTSFMGLTKRICEIILLFYSEKIHDNDKKNYFIVRFGNVFESSGSVIPLFKKQIDEGKPITLTSENATRFFMSIPEAVNLILSAQKIVKKNEIFIFEMGKPVKIIDIAHKLIFLKSLETNHIGNFPIKIIGLREGEKEHEVLSSGKLIKTQTLNIFESEEKKIDLNLAKNLIQKIENYKFDHNFYEFEQIVKKID